MSGPPGGQGGMMGQVGYGGGNFARGDGPAMGGGYPQTMPSPAQFTPQPQPQMGLGGQGGGSAPPWFSQPGQQAGGLVAQLGGFQRPQTPNLGGQGGGYAPPALNHRIAQRFGGAAPPMISDNFNNPQQRIAMPFRSGGATAR